MSRTVNNEQYKNIFYNKYQNLFVMILLNTIPQGDKIDSASDWAWAIDHQMVEMDGVR